MSIYWHSTVLITASLLRSEWKFCRNQKTFVQKQKTRSNDEEHRYVTELCVWYRERVCVCIHVEEWSRKLDFKNTITNPANIPPCLHTWLLLARAIKKIRNSLNPLLRTIVWAINKINNEEQFSSGIINSNIGKFDLVAELVNFRIIDHHDFQTVQCVVY